MAARERSRYRVVLGGHAPKGLLACFEHIGMIEVGGITGPLVRRSPGAFYQMRGKNYWRLTDRKVVKALDEQGVTAVILDLQRIVRECCSVFRGPGSIANADFAVLEPMPLVAQPFTQLVDCHYVVIGVDTLAAERCRAEVAAMVGRWPGRCWSQGPSFVDVAADAGGQLNALCLFAIGHVLHLWTVIVPMDVVEADAFEGLSQSLVRVNGYRAALAAA